MDPEARLRNMFTATYPTVMRYARHRGPFGSATVASSSVSRRRHLRTQSF